MGIFDILFGNKKEKERLQKERLAEQERQRQAEERKIAEEREKRLSENRRKEAERKAKIEAANSKKYRRTRQTLWRAVQMLTQKLCCQTIHDCPKVVPLHYESE